VKNPDIIASRLEPPAFMAVMVRQGDGSATIYTRDRDARGQDREQREEIPAAMIDRVITARNLQRIPPATPAAPSPAAPSPAAPSPAAPSPAAPSPAAPSPAAPDALPVRPGPTPRVLARESRLALRRE
jgi:hypothetical protein